MRRITSLQQNINFIVHLFSSVISYATFYSLFEVIGFKFHWLFIRLCISSFPELLNHRAKRLWKRSLCICKQNCVCSNVSCHHLQDLPTWFHPQDRFAPINSPIHVPNPYWSTAGNELHTCGPLRPYSTVTPHKYGLWCFKHVLSIDTMHTNLEKCELTLGDLSYTNNQIWFFLRVRINSTMSLITHRFKTCPWHPECILSPSSFFWSPLNFTSRLQPNSQETGRKFGKSRSKKMGWSHIQLKEKLMGKMQWNGETSVYLS